MQCKSCGQRGGIMYMGSVAKALQPRHLGPCIALGMAARDSGHEVVMKVAMENEEHVRVFETGDPELDEMLKMYAEALGLEVEP